MANSKVLFISSSHPGAEMSVNPPICASRSGSAHDALQGSCRLVLLTVSTPGHHTSSHCPGLYTNSFDSLASFCPSCCCSGSTSSKPKLFTVPVAFSTWICRMRADKMGADRQSLAVLSMWSGRVGVSGIPLSTWWDSARFERTTPGRAGEVDPYVAAVAGALSEVERLRRLIECADEATLEQYGTDERDRLQGKSQMTAADESGSLLAYTTPDTSERRRLLETAGCIGRQ